MSRKIVYISHPYSGQKDVIKKVDAICQDAIASGVLPLSPIHLFAYTDDNYRDHIMPMCLRLVQMADELWLYGSSEGCKAEATAAENLGIPVVWKGKENEN